MPKAGILITIVGLAALLTACNVTIRNVTEVPPATSTRAEVLASLTFDEVRKGVEARTRAALMSRTSGQTIKVESMQSCNDTAIFADKMKKQNATMIWTALAAEGQIIQQAWYVKKWIAIVEHFQDGVTCFISIIKEPEMKLDRGARTASQ